MHRALTILAFFVVAGCAAARGDDGIWTALVLATDEKPAKPVPAALKPFAGGLRGVFGYNSFYLLGAKQKEIRKGDEEWIVPTKKVFLKVHCLDRTDKGYRLQLEVYVKKRLVVGSEVRLERGAPLYIRGPNWGKGRMVFILEDR